MPAYRPAIERFHEKYRIDPEIGMWIESETGDAEWSPCWIWAAARSAKGYGSFRNEEKQTVQAHNYSYATFVGPIDPSLERAHQCFNRTCVNPKHIKQMTHRENVLQSRHPTILAYLEKRCVKGHPIEGDNVRVETNGSLRCKKCFTEYQAAYHMANRTKRLERMREYGRNHPRSKRGTYDLSS
jgi:hypothetical protein